MARAEPQVSALVEFLRSALAPKQIAELIALLKQGEVITLDPEIRKPGPGAAVSQTPPAQPLAPATHQGLSEILVEMETAYSVEKYSPLTPDESRRVRDAFPNFIERCNAFQGRHLVKMLRERLKL